MSKTSSLAEALDYVVRPAEDGDLGLVVESWSRSVYELHRDARLSVFRRQLRDYINRRLDAGDRILVACAREAPTVVHAWACWCPVPGLVRFVYTKPEYRRAGIARALLQDTGLALPILTSSRLTPVARTIKQAHPDSIVYVPFAD